MKTARKAATGLDGDMPAQTIIEAQDREIGLASGRPRGKIKQIGRTPAKPTPRAA
jgi:hypothetical protein